MGDVISVIANLIAAIAETAGEAAVATEILELTTLTATEVVGETTAAVASEGLFADIATLGAEGTEGLFWSGEALLEGEELELFSAEIEPALEESFIEEEELLESDIQALIDRTFDNDNMWFAVEELNALESTSLQNLIEMGSATTAGASALIKVAEGLAVGGGLGALGGTFYGLMNNFMKNAASFGRLREAVNTYYGTTLKTKQQVSEFFKKHFKIRPRQKKYMKEFLSVLQGKRKTKNLKKKKKRSVKKQVKKTPKKRKTTRATTPGAKFVQYSEHKRKRRRR